MTKESQTFVRAQIGALEIWLKSHGVWWDEEAIFIDAESTVEMNNGKRVPLCIRAKRAIAVDDIGTFFVCLYELNVFLVSL